VTKVFPIRSTKARVFLVAGFLVLTATLFLIGKWGFANMVSTRADTVEVANLAIDWATSDPQTHFTAAVLYDRTFLPDDQLRSLSEYETALALSPNNYLLWLEYGKALSRSGDLDRAEAAFREAQKLAPNYSSVSWALGNLLVRKGNEAEGFAQIGRAVNGDSSLAAPAGAFAYQYFDGDLTRVRNLTGSSPEAISALATLLAKNKRYEDALEIWKTLPVTPHSESVQNAGRTLINELVSAKKFNLAMHVVNTLEPAVSIAPEQLYDGGFEEGIKLENAGPFEWRFSAGTQPQPLQSTSQPHGGGKSLVLRFSSGDGNGLRQMSQTVVVKPNSKYIFRGFYRIADLKASSDLVWQIIGASGPIAEVPLGHVAPQWSEFKGAFTVPSDSDGIEIRLLIKSCGSAICPISGSVFLDDVELVSDISR
jgi:tetratricopeptide (TPR) repeat protein